ncbi:hypothetical protein QUF58_07775 [Anaerolineales bacterium HSG24]|nr:hypothetical protein [Anaerolineales bacterium HSG24]
MCDHLRSAPASPVIPWIQGEARRIGVLISNQRYTALPSPYNCQTRKLLKSHSLANHYYPTSSSGKAKTGTQRKSDLFLTLTESLAGTLQRILQNSTDIFRQ